MTGSERKPTRPRNALPYTDDNITHTMSSDQDHLKETDTEARFEFKKEQKSSFQADKGLTEETIRVISEDKDEPEWMLERRLRALEQEQIWRCSEASPGAPELFEVDVDEIVPYIRPDIETRGGVDDWNGPAGRHQGHVRQTGNPGSREERPLRRRCPVRVRSRLPEHAGTLGGQRRHLLRHGQGRPRTRRHRQGVLHDQGVPPSDNKFAALHGAIWSGGSFVYVPEDTTVDMPVQAYFRMNSEGMGQFEHTLIIAEEGSEVHYIEGCSAPKYSAFNLHSGGVEVFVGEDAHVQYSTVQNWSKNTYNLNTKRAIVEKNGRMEWISGSMGSKATMLYPCSILKGRGASDNHITIAFAGEGQNIDTGAKVYHNAPNTKSTIESKSI